MRKIILLIAVAMLLGACTSPQGQEAYLTKMKTNLAAEHKVIVSNIKISFMQSCVFDVDSVDTIMYVKVGDSQTVYQYIADHCREGEIQDFTKSIYSEDGTLPDSLEKKYLK